MQVEIITKEDLEMFRIQLLRDISELLKPAQAEPQKEWLKSSEVRKILRVSAGTLQNLRVTGKLKPSKINGTYYYRSKEITNLLEKGV